MTDRRSLDILKVKSGDNKPIRDWTYEGMLLLETDTLELYQLKGGQWVRFVGSSGSGVDSVNGFTGTVTLDTDDIAEATNLYFTDARAVTAIKADPAWNAADWDTAFGWGDWSVGVDKTFVDALNVDADTLDGQDFADFDIPIAINGQPSLYMAEGIVDPRVARAWKRASTGTRRAQNGLIETVPADTPRLNFNPDGTFDKYLIEPAATNVLLHSEDFTNAAWNKVGVTITANAETAPDGKTTADRLTQSAGNTNDRIEQSFTVTTNTDYVISGWFKAAPNHDGSTERLNLLFSGGTVARDSFSFTPPQEWERFELTLNSGDNTNLIARAFRANGPEADIYMWGAQLELGTKATSYIPTTTAAVTRAADDVVIDGADFDALGIADGGTVVAEAVKDFADQARYGVWSVNDGGGSNRIQLWQWDGDPGKLVPSITAGGVESVNARIPFVSGTTRVAFAFATNDAAWSQDGGTVVTDATVTMPAVDRLAIGNVAGGNNALNGGIRALIIYPNRLTNAELEAASAVGQKLPGLAETTNRITQQFPYNATPYTPYALTDVTTTGQTRTLDVTNGPVQTIEATEDFTLNAAGPAGKTAAVTIYIHNDNATTNIGLSTGTGVLFVPSGDITFDSTLVIEARWDGLRLMGFSEQEGSGDLRPT